jgi:hypothetical protein
MFRNLNFICEVNGLLPLTVGLLIRKCINVVEVLPVHAYHQGQMSLQVIM